MIEVWLHHPNLNKKMDEPVQRPLVCEEERFYQPTANKRVLHSVPQVPTAVSSSVARNVVMRILAASPSAGPCPFRHRIRTGFTGEGQRELMDR